MSNQRGGKTLIITDDEEVEEVEELNPFSFREFLRWKNQDPDPEQARTEEEEEEWGRSFQSGIGSTSSLCTEEEEEEEETRFSSKPEAAAGGGAVGGGENYEGDDETSMAEPATFCRRRSARSSQTQQLKEENAALRRTVRELQRRAEVNERRASQLSEELLQRRRQEEKEAQDLESMVHSVEQNLHLMTRRAVKAENAVSKLKAELQQLQRVCVCVFEAEVDSLRAENNGLKSMESQVVMTMRQNAQVASDYLNKMASHAHSSIRQLLGEAETLRLVSQLLQSIDKISSLNSES
ncbi:endosome-associated-trafficking regulator 1 isoform X1 [Pundamilia nyererei]|uniref:Endosome-associated-trafficking regulator 1 n=1 Tax=Pundamilia nyererei TaxID=303518 RepID=A0A9Y3RSZ0_9CICH|nr:PREDICTED: serologically defined colon cancer antigen 3 isoform X1 [Pundamilia nyererei]